MKKGFTLIELLAVIIILAIVSVIATPIILDVVNDSKESGNKSSIVLYADAIYLEVTSTWFKNGSYPNVNKEWVDTNVKYSGNRVVCNKVYYDKESGPILHECTVGSEASLLNNVVQADTMYCYAKKEVFNDCSTAEYVNRLNTFIYNDNTVPELIAKNDLKEIDFQENIDVTALFNYKFGDAGGNIECNYSNTSELESGTYLLTCNAIGNNGKTSGEVTISLKVLNSYTITYNLNGGIGDIPSQVKKERHDAMVTDIVPTRNEYKFLGWSTSSSATTSQYNSGSVYSNDSNVVLFAVWKSDYLGDNVKLGDYIQMTPTISAWTVNNTSSTAINGYGSYTIEPNRLNIWRVIKINADKTVDVISDKVASTAIFKAGTGFSYYAKSLNIMASKYANEKYVQSTRHFGYNGQTEIVSICKSNGCSSNVDGGVSLYTKDANLVTSALGTLVAKNLSNTASIYFAVARNLTNSSSMSSNPKYTYSIGYITTSGTFTTTGLQTSKYNGGGEWSDTTESFTANIRPILTLKSNIVTPSGNGTSNSPYVLN